MAPSAWKGLQWEVYSQQKKMVFSMDKILFERIIVRNDRAWICAKILINEIPLIDIVYNYEKAHISHNKNYKPSYEYDCAVELYSQIKNAFAAKKKSKICLLVCTCMEAGCNSFKAYIHETKNSVVLSGFQNPRFTKKKNYNDIDYTKFDKYQFDKLQFMSELAKLKTFAPSGEYSIPWGAQE